MTVMDEQKKEGRRCKTRHQGTFVRTKLNLPGYNHATSNLAIHSHETSQDKLSEA